MAAGTAYIDEHRDRFREELEAFLGIPSVSTESRFASEVRRAADWLRNHMEQVGLEDAEVIPTAGHPIVYARHTSGEDAPTLLVYGHYDVQPSDPDDLWTSPPFQPAVRDGRLYARGATDDKGQVHMHLKAVESRLRAGEGLPVNLVFLIEGEEEVGSAHLEAFLREHRERLACDAVVISDTTMFAPDIPCITTGLRGIVYTEVVFRGPDRDLHSGSYGGAVVNPANALAKVIGKLHGRDRRVTVPGFYDRVREPNKKEREAIERLPFKEKDLKKDVGAPALGGEKGWSALERLWYRPTLDVNGLLSGFTGEGAKTVLPSKAMAKVSMRLVPDQDPDEIARAFEAHVRDLAPKGVEVEVKLFHGGRPWAADPEGPLFDAARAALSEAFGGEAVFIREGGSIPIVPLFEETFDAPVLLVGFGLPGSNPHAPDEWLDLSVYYRGIEALGRLYEEVGKRGV